MLKSCKYCGAVHDKKFVCNEKQIAYDKQKKNKQSRISHYNQTNVDNFRNTKTWKNKRLEIRERDNNLCQVCFRELYDTVQRLTYEQLSVHHNVCLKRDFSKRLDDYNLITLCRYHHRLADEGVIPMEVIDKIIEEQENEKEKREKNDKM